MRGAAPGLRPRAAHQFFLRQIGRRPQPRARRLLRKARHCTAPWRQGYRHRPRAQARALRARPRSHAVASAPSRSHLRRARSVLGERHEQRARRDPRRRGDRARGASRLRGGGLLGLEAAKALHDLGLETHVVEFAPRLMAVQLDDSGGRLLRREIEALGVGVHTSKETTKIVKGAERRHRLLFADGGSRETDLVVFSAGIRPRDQLARAAGLAIGERGGIVINDHCQTSDPDIYALGECALWGGRSYGLVAPGYQM
ncbi:MAG: FAD-dependent oxidoreductase, partial [Betaproteobacteria bacterium]|nr:FAD-dependent oxidoreductase [Betaproteobacteria bacterium]